MNQRLFRLLSTLLVALLILPLFCCSASAAGLPKRDYVEDNALVLTADECNRLNNSAEAASSKYECSVSLLFTASDGRYDLEAFADAYFDDNNMGYSKTEDGIVLVIDVLQRTYHMSTSGYGIDAFTDSGLEKVADDIIPYLRVNDWNGAAEEFISSCSRLLRQARNGNPYDTASQSSSSHGFRAELLGFSGILGVLFGGLPLHKQKKALQTVHKQENASQYIYGQNPVLTLRVDRYITSNIVRVRKSENNSSSGHSGGSSVHTSSSGHTHGGRGGSF